MWKCGFQGGQLTAQFLVLVGLHLVLRDILEKEHPRTAAVQRQMLQSSGVPSSLRDIYCKERWSI